MDALAAGLTFAFLKVNMLVASLTIGIMALVITATGFMVGRKSNELLGKRAEVIGGIILVGTGLRILLSHIL
ncbi:MAG: manganese efflux pump [Chloroflexi bacterium]|nr:manganese efflux pump [Chloroflexota bacterium]